MSRIFLQLKYFSADTDSSGKALCCPEEAICVSAIDSSGTYRQPCYEVLTKIICFGLQGLLIDKFKI